MGSKSSSRKPTEQEADLAEIIASVERHAEAYATVPQSIAFAIRQFFDRRIVDLGHVGRLDVVAREAERRIEKHDEAKGD